MILHASAAQARRFLVARHRLLPPRAQRGVLELIDHLGSLQFDPLEIPGARNHELVLHARIAGYRRGVVERWLYGKDRRLFEAWNKSLSILPLEELPYHRVVWRRREHLYGEIFRTNAGAIEGVLAALGDRGPLLSTFFSRSPELSRSVVWGWGATRLGRGAARSTRRSRPTAGSSAPSGSRWRGRRCGRAEPARPRRVWRRRPG